MRMLRRIAKHLLFPPFTAAALLVFFSAALLMGIVYRSYWLMALGVYYAVLALMCFFLLRGLGSEGTCAASPAAQCRAYHLTGAMMLVLGMVMSAIIFQVVRDNQTYRYPSVVIYAFAAYAFYKIILAVINLIRRRGRETPLLAAVRRADPGHRGHAGDGRGHEHDDGLRGRMVFAGHRRRPAGHGRHGPCVSAVCARGEAGTRARRAGDSAAEPRAAQVKPGKRT